MRLSVKATLLLLAGYVLLMGALALGIDRWLHAAERAMTAESVRMLAREGTALLVERIYGALEAPDAASRQLLRERIQDLVLLSEVVSSFVVVNEDGEVVGNDGRDAPTRLPRPSEVFRDGLEVKALPLTSDSFFQGGDYVVLLPLEDRGRLLGYVRVELHSSRVAQLYADARGHLLRLGIAGLAGVVLLGFLLMVQVAHSAADIRLALGEAPAPRSILPHADDELSRTLDAANRMRRALNEARREGSRLHLGFDALAQVTKTGVLLVAVDGTVAFANPRALELFGADSLEALSPRWADAGPRLDEAFRGADGEPEAPEACTLELPAADGRRLLRLEAYRLGDAGEKLVLVSDPRIRDTLESDVRLASQLEGLARTYRAAAHEIKAPLSAVMINLDLLREALGEGGDAGDSKARQERYVSVLREELTRLNRSLAEILTQALPSPAEPQRLDLARILRELGSLLAPQARRQGVALRLEVAEEEVPLVGHRDRLKQAFLNVAVNALEAMPQGGKMEIELRREADRARILVRDTGPGIPPEILDRLYEPDFTTKGTGSGIGLYVARALVQLHGGTIAVASEAGRGTEVRIELPLVAAG